MLQPMIQLRGSALTIDAVVRVARCGEMVSIAAEAMVRMQRSRGEVERALAGDKAVYALNTGVGLLANVRLEPASIEQMQLNLVRSHCCGVGEPLPIDVVRAMMLIRANTLTMGLSGIRPVVAEMLCDLLNHGITPVVPMRGSVGASGDLAPLAHMALVLIGEGEAFVGGERVPAAACLREAGLRPLKLQAKEGISLLNGTQAMLAIGCLQVHHLDRLFEAAQMAAAMTLQALRGTPSAYDERLHARPASSRADIQRGFVAGSAGRCSASQCKCQGSGCVLPALRTAGTWCGVGCAPLCRAGLRD